VKPQVIFRSSDDNKTALFRCHFPDPETELQGKFVEGWEIGFWKGWKGSVEEILGLIRRV